MAAFDVKVKDAKGDEFTLHVEGVKTLAEAQAHAQMTGAKLNEPKVVDVPPTPAWLDPPAPAKSVPAKTTNKTE